MPLALMGCHGILLFGGTRTVFPDIAHPGEWRKDGIQDNREIS